MNFRAVMSIKAKLAALGATGAVVSSIMGVVAFQDIDLLNNALQGADVSAQAVRNHMEADMMHDAIRADVLAALRAKTPDEHKAALDDVHEHAQAFREAIDKNTALTLPQEVSDAIDAAHPALTSYFDSGTRLVELAQSNAAAAEHDLPAFFAAFKSLEEQMESISNVIEQNAAAATKNGETARASAIRSMTITLAGGLAALLVFAFVLGRSITRPLALLNTRLKDISEGEGDLTKRVDDSRADEIGHLAASFNAFVHKIEQLVIEVRAGASQIDAGASQISGASQSLAQGASEQASSLQQISASIEQMSGQTQHSSENARQAAAIAGESKKAADRGQHEMGEMNQAVAAIKQSSGEISKIIKVIDEIAFQTNLLALNAAVEAARAGEAGKGFAVVAQEVRNLAQRSAEAAKSTSGMIEESVKRAEAGVQIASRVGSVLHEITDATNKVNTLLSEIAAASGEQATGINQVNQGVSQLDQVTQQNAGNSEELASSAEQLSSQVASLNDLVGQFRVRDHASARATTHTPAST